VYDPTHVSVSCPSISHRSLSEPCITGTTNTSWAWSATTRRRYCRSSFQRYTRTRRHIGTSKGSIGSRVNRCYLRIVLFRSTTTEKHGNLGGLEALLFTSGFSVTPAKHTTISRFFSYCLFTAGIPFMLPRSLVRKHVLFRVQAVCLTVASAVTCWQPVFLVESISARAHGVLQDGSRWVTLNDGLVSTFKVAGQNHRICRRVKMLPALASCQEVEASK